MRLRLIKLWSIFLILSSACKNPTDNVFVHISPDFYDYVVSIQLKDLSRVQENLAYNGSFTVGGPSQGDIYAIDGTRNFSFSGGETALIVNRLTAEPTKGNPIIFNIALDIDGFRSKTIEVEIKEGELYSEELVYLLPEDPVIEGLALERKNAAVNSDGSLAERVLIDFSTQSDTLPARFNLAIDSGITFQDRQGQPIVGGSLEIDLVGFDTYSDNSTLSLPNSSLIQLLEIDGIPQQRFFGPMPRLDFNLSVNGKEVKSISGGKVFTRINIPETTNLTTLETYARGDTIDVVSYDEQDQYWKYIDTRVVEQDSESKFVRVELDNFSSKSFNRITKDQSNLHVIINTSGHLMQYSDFRAEFDGGDGPYTKLIKRTANSSYDVMLDPAIIFFVRQNPNIGFVEVSTGSGLFSSRAPATAANSISVRWNATSDTVIYTLKPSAEVFKGYYTAFCEEQPNVLLYPPVGTKVYIKEAGTDEYSLAPVHIVTKENKNELEFNTAAVEDGKIYDIKIRYSGEDVAERLGVRAVYGDTIEVKIPNEDCAALGI